MASCWPRVVDFIPIAILLTTLINLKLAAGQQQAPVATEPPAKIPIPNLPPSHYQFWLKNSPSALTNFERVCSDSAPNQGLIKNLKQSNGLHSNLTFEDTRISDDLSYNKRFLENICSKIHLVKKSCWGYEANCEIIYLMPECNPSSSDDHSEQEKKIEKWFNQADFGYVLDRRRELSKYCAPDKHSNHSVKSSLECTKYFKMCRGDNLYLKLDDNQSVLQEGPMSLRKGHIGGWNCDLQVKRIQEEGGQRGFLKSWFNELKNYGLLHRLQPEKACEEQIDKQVYLVQPDSTNMYHYFCTFLNLYATMHLNNRFSEDNQLILWDKKLPQSNFEVMWSVFSKNRLRSLDEFKGKQVCLKKFIFTMPPRMDSGLYHNTPLVDGCSKSGLFDAFNKHVLYKLGIGTQDCIASKRSSNQEIYVTIVSRSTPTRRILNEADLKDAADNISAGFRTQIVDFANISFIDQLKITHSTDILVGVHGAGLTHTLFLPESAALIELYDCKEERYRNLARLRGVSYFTLEDHKNSGDKSENFTVNVQAFVRILKAAAEEVKKQKGEPILDETKVSHEPVKTDVDEIDVPEVKPKEQQDRTEL